jgi:hypothetical protein
MSVINEVNKVSYNASGNASYPIPFFFTENEHIRLFLNDDEKILGDDFEVGGARNPLGGELTFLIAPPATGLITIFRQIPLRQENSFNEGGPFHAKTVESMFDKLTLIAQQIDEVLRRAVKFPVTSTVEPQMIGNVSPHALLKVNAAGDGLEMGLSVDQYATILDQKLIDCQALLEATEAALVDTLAILSETESVKTQTEAVMAQAEAATAAAESAQVAAEAARDEAIGAVLAVEDDINELKDRATALEGEDVAIVARLENLEEVKTLIPIGDQGANGSWRIILVDGSLQIEVRNAGAWVIKDTFNP